MCKIIALVCTDYNNDGQDWWWVDGNRTLTGWKNWPTNDIINTPGQQDCVTIDSSTSAKYLLARPFVRVDITVQVWNTSTAACTKTRKGLVVK